MSDEHEFLDEEVSGGERPISIPRELPVLPLRDTVLFPNSFMPLAVARESSVRLIEEAIADSRVVGVFTQLEPGTEEPTQEDLYPVGTATHIHKMFKLPDGTLRLIVQGQARLHLDEVFETKPYIRARVRRAEEGIREGDRLEIDALQRNIKNNFQQVVSLSPLLSDDLQALAGSITEPGKLTDFIASSLTTIPTTTKQQVLGTLDVRARISAPRAAQGDPEGAGRGGRSDQGDRGAQRQARRGWDAGVGQERGVARARPVVADAGGGRRVHGVTHVSRLAGGAALEPPHRRVLDEDHTGLEKVKDRILEYLAVRKLKPDVKGPILCFVGPPGVGKTSLAKSIARSLDRKFVRVSLGGMRDEAEIRGHRRTYIGALPGQVIQGLRRAESKNPVFILDEIDKLGADFRGDPSSALLEVLDPEQNNTFRDHYLDVPFDLSEVLFITTANVLDPVAPPLRDRMEVLDLPGYTEEEKLQIATEHLVDRQVENNGLKPEQLSFTDDALRALIRGYTREAGVRNLEREIGALCRKVARRHAEGTVDPVEIVPDMVTEMLGAPRFEDEEVAERTKNPGVALGLAWTPAGGEVDVMKESARAALSWFRGQTDAYGVDSDFYQNSEIHLHVPSGAIPKDGPSAGVTMVTALASELTGRPVRGDLAMTGEITLSGHVLPVGGIKEKVLAARRHGVFEVVMPRQNEKNVNEDLSADLRRDMTIHFISTIDDVLKLSLRPATARPATDVTPVEEPEVRGTVQ